MIVCDLCKSHERLKSVVRIQLDIHLCDRCLVDAGGMPDERTLAQIARRAIDEALLAKNAQEPCP